MVLLEAVCRCLCAQSDRLHRLKVAVRAITTGATHRRCGSERVCSYGQSKRSERDHPRIAPISNGQSVFPVADRSMSALRWLTSGIFRPKWAQSGKWSDAKARLCGLQCEEVCGRRVVTARA